MTSKPRLGARKEMRRIGISLKTSEDLMLILYALDRQLKEVARRDFNGQAALASFSPR